MQEAGEASADWFEPDCDHWETYRYSLQATYLDTLADIYPVTRAVLGARVFDRLGLDYLAAQPSTSGDLHDYGEQLADHIADCRRLDGLPYLAELAHLEWATHRAFHAADAQALTVTDLAAGDVRIGLHPACRLLHCEWPVSRIWQAHQAGEPSDEIDLAGCPTAVLLSRPEHVVWVSPLTGPAAGLTEALLAGCGLEQACSRLRERVPGADLATALYPLLAAGALVDVAGGPSPTD